MKPDEEGEMQVKDTAVALREVPEIFFSRRFNLEEPQTFIDYVTSVSGTTQQEKVSIGFLYTFDS